MPVKKMKQFDVTVRVPASTANLGSGFDAIGMALNLYTTIKMRRASQTYVALKGNNLEGLPTGKNNMIYQAAIAVFNHAGSPIPELEIEVESEIPLTRGLGSSAAAIVGGMVAANELLEEPLSQNQLFQLAAEIEGHPDNVGASLFGGIIAAAKTDSKISYVQFPPPQGIRAVVAIPDYTLSTAAARDVLPSSYSREDTVHAIGHSALLVAALARGELSVLYEAMSDRIHQPYRATLIPGLEELLTTSKHHGAIGIALSGAGPTIIALTDKDDQPLSLHIDQVLHSHGIKANVLTLSIDTVGVTVETKINAKKTFTS
ncbi:homoserine kinase [Bacillus oleivorans]|uniref:Homoserine kinase n=2 Tax=Bacillus oleivorans TaxID=1448271 RepID=A0A285CGS1_9BACI|nr:homoserine kinase [Bacillus oleivorans]